MKSRNYKWEKVIHRRRFQTSVVAMDEERPRAFVAGKTSGLDGTGR